MKHTKLEFLHKTWGYISKWVIKQITTYGKLLDHKKE